MTEEADETDYFNKESVLIRRFRHIRVLFPYKFSAFSISKQALKKSGRKRLFLTCQWI